MNTALIEELVRAKRIEDEARERRIEAEQAIIAELGEIKPEGQTAIKAGGYKLTVTGSMNRRIDGSVLAAVRESIPAALFDQAIRWKPEVNLTGLRYLQNNEPDTYSILAEAITTTPAKPSVRVEKLEP
jgi:hypothetical protein